MTQYKTQNIENQALFRWLKTLLICRLKFPRWNSRAILRSVACTQDSQSKAPYFIYLWQIFFFLGICWSTWIPWPCWSRSSSCMLQKLNILRKAFFIKQFLIALCFLTVSSRFSVGLNWSPWRSWSAKQERS